MLVFSVDSRRLFKQGQQHELKILFPSSKRRLNNSKRTESVDSINRSSYKRDLNPYGSSDSSSNSGSRGANDASSQYSGSQIDTNQYNGHLSSQYNGSALSQCNGYRYSGRNSNYDCNERQSLGRIRENGTIHYSNKMAHPVPMSTMSGLSLSSPRVNESVSRYKGPGGRNGLLGDSISYGARTDRPIPPERRRRRNSSASVRTRKTYNVRKPFPVDESSLSVASIVIRCDSVNGKFGFNVKGGVDQNQPLLVSRVASGTPADRCYPKLNEGDQVLYINGRDVSDMTHEEVVTLIRSSREAPLGELRLTVKQNVYEPEGLDEPSFQYVPETIPEGGSIKPEGSMAESLLLLSEGLEAGSLVAQFDQCYRRKPGVDMFEARKAENEKKNRYRDISPYDTTRVVLTTSSNGDYINASHVKMTIPPTNLINHYIACQGPLRETAQDFWRMVWEQESNLVVMLTTVVEQGRIKCYRYWPQHCESCTFGPFKIACVKEEETPGFAYREFLLTHSELHESRCVNHMQYLAWPDHGVPDDSAEFLKFVYRVRQYRKGSSSPTIVHCSAGIGRTGVLILMETAQCLMEANQPVYPLDIVRTMRDQRAMMIQTASQYRFVCEAIRRFYLEDSNHQKSPVEREKR